MFGSTHFIISLYFRFIYYFQTLKANVSVEDSKKQKKQILEFENDLYAIRQENENNLSTSAKEYKSTKNEIEKLKTVDAKLENDLSALQSLLSVCSNDSETSKLIMKDMNKNISLLKTEKELNLRDKENNLNTMATIEAELSELKSEISSSKKKNNYNFDLNKEKIDEIDNEILDIKNRQDKASLLQNKYNTEYKKEITEINFLLSQKSFFMEDDNSKNKEDDKKKQIIKDKIESKKEERIQQEREEILSQLLILQNENILSAQKIQNLEKKLIFLTPLEAKVFIYFFLIRMYLCPRKND